MKAINLKSDYKSLIKEDKEPAQNVDFDLWCFSLQSRVQDLYDKVFVNGKATFEQKAKLDFIYTQIQEIIRQGDGLIK